MYTLRARSRGRTRTHSDWDTLGLDEQGRYRTSFHLGKIGCSGDEENNGKDLTDTSMTFAATPPVEGFRFLLSRAMTGEKKRNPQDELVIAFFDISGAHFHSPVRKKSCDQNAR